MGRLTDYSFMLYQFPFWWSFGGALMVLTTWPIISVPYACYRERGWRETVRFWKLLCRVLRVMFCWIWGLNHAIGQIRETVWHVIGVEIDSMTMFAMMDDGRCVSARMTYERRQHRIRWRVIGAEEIVVAKVTGSRWVDGRMEEIRPWTEPYRINVWQEVEWEYSHLLLRR